MKAILAAILSLPFLVASCGTIDDASTGEGNQTTRSANAMKIRLKVGDRSATATLLDSPTSKEFASLLPLKVKMHDLFGREKAGPLPKAISTGGKPSFAYKVGDIGYWSPSRDVAIYYKQDGDAIPQPGIIMIGRLEAEGSKLFEVPGSVTVTIEKEPNVG